MSRVAAPLHPLARTQPDWAEALAARGERPFRAAQVFRWIHARGVVDPAKMTDLPATLRDALSAEGLGPTTMTAEVRTSLDGTRKLLVRLRLGEFDPDGGPFAGACELAGTFLRGWWGEPPDPPFAPPD